VAAFREGEPWLNELREYLYRNKQIVKDYLEKELPEVKLVPSQATYLLWLDCRNVEGGGRGLANRIRRETGLFLTAGFQYGKAGEDFLRMNIACPADLLREGLKRLKQGLS
jgi:cystathionine beta-lyase